MFLVQDTAYELCILIVSNSGTCTLSSYFGCFDGGCVYSSRCDGDSDCSDGSDEVACTSE